MWCFLISGAIGCLFVCLRSQDKAHIFFQIIPLWAYIHTSNYHFFRKLLPTTLSFTREKKNAYWSSHHLTKFKMCNSPVVVQFGLQFFLIAVHFNSFGVKMNSIDEISFLEGLITLIPINISCSCKRKNKNNLIHQSLL